MNGFKWADAPTLEGDLGSSMFCTEFIAVDTSPHSCTKDGHGGVVQLSRGPVAVLF